MTPELSLPSFTGNRNIIDIFLYNWRALLLSSKAMTKTQKSGTITKTVSVKKEANMLNDKIPVNKDMKRDT